MEIIIVTVVWFIIVYLLLKRFQRYLKKESNTIKPY